HPRLPGLPGDVRQPAGRLRRDRRDDHVPRPARRHGRPGPVHGSEQGMSRARGWTVAGYVAMVIVTLVVAVPLFWILITSFKERQDIYVRPAQWWPDPATKENYVHVTTRIA